MDLSADRISILSLHSVGREDLAPASTPPQSRRTEPAYLPFGKRQAGQHSQRFSEAGSGTAAEVAALPPLTNEQWLA